MALYCGIDLHSRDSWLAILDDGLKVVREAKVGNDLEAILDFLEPYREDLKGIAVESTFNWYWLVDGLAEAGYQMHLVNTWAVKQWEGLKEGCEGCQKGATFTIAPLADRVHVIQNWIEELKSLAPIE